MNIHIKIAATILTLAFLPLASHAQWREVAPMNYARRGQAAVAHDGKIYVFGGMGMRMRLAYRSAECYDPASNNWTEIADPPLPLHYAAAAASGDYIYIFGGDTAAGHLSSRVIRYDPAADNYQTVARMPYTLMGHAAVPVGDQILIIGGVDGDGNYADHCLWFSPDSNRVTEGPELNQPRINFGVAYSGRAVWIMGGLFHGLLNHIEQYSGRRWEGAAAGLPIPRGGLGAAFMDSTLIVVGGRYRAGDAVSDVIGHRIGGEGWFRMFPLGQARVDLALVNLDGRIYAIGGADAADLHMSPVTATVEVLDEVVSVKETDPGLPDNANLLVFPNPVNGWATFRLPVGAAGITLTDLTGRLVFATPPEQGVSQLRWNSAPFNSGIYLYRISSASGTPLASGSLAVTK